MICKKCGREYEDDMLKCLWCDAPNENHVPPDPSETIMLSEVLNTDVGTIIENNVDPVILRNLEKEGVETAAEEIGEKVAKHPAGHFMWCAAILGAGGLFSALLVPFYIALFHRKEIRKQHSLGKFISIYFGSIFTLNCIVGSLSKMTKEAVEIHLRGDAAVALNGLIDLAQNLIYLALCGYISAFVIKRLTPDYAPAEYKSTSRSATLYAVPVMYLMMTLSEIVFKMT